MQIWDHLMNTHICQFVSSIYNNIICHPDSFLLHPWSCVLRDHDWSYRCYPCDWELATHVLQSLFNFRRMHFCSVCRWPWELQRSS